MGFFSLSSLQSPKNRIHHHNSIRNTKQRDYRAATNGFDSIDRSTQHKLGQTHDTEEKEGDRAISRSPVSCCCRCIWFNLMKCNAFTFLYYTDHLVLAAAVSMHRLSALHCLRFGLFQYSVLIFRCFWGPHCWNNFDAVNFAMCVPFSLHSYCIIHFVYE